MPFRDLDAYIKQARRANSDRELFSCSEAAARQLGLPWLAIVQSMAFFQPGGRYFRMDNFQSWGDVFVAEGYYRDDPALLAARSTSRAFCWHEMERLLGGFTRRQARIVREAARHGLRNGLTVPIGVAGEPPGCCTFATRDGQLPPSQCFRLAAMGKSDVEIGIMMNIAPTTVRTYMRDLREHFGIYSRAQLPAIALACGIVCIEEIVPRF